MLIVGNQTVASFGTDIKIGGKVKLVVVDQGICCQAPINVELAFLFKLIIFQLEIIDLVI